jgi:hypothetical protein
VGLGGLAASGNEVKEVKEIKEVKDPEKSAVHF